MSDAVAPLHLGMIGAAVAKDAQTPIRRWLELESRSVRQRTSVRIKMVFRTPVMMCFGVKVPVLDIEAHGQRNAAFGCQIAPERDSRLRSEELKHCRIASIEHVDREQDFHGAIISSAGHETPLRRRPGAEVHQVLEIQGSDESVGVDPEARALDKDVTVDRHGGMQVSPKQTI